MKNLIAYILVQVVISTLFFNEALSQADAGSPEDSICGLIYEFNATPVGGTWTIISTPPAGNANFADANSTTTTVTADTYGTYTFRWTVGAFTDDIDVRFDEQPTTATVGANQILCAGNLQSDQLGGNIPSVGTGLWTLVSGPGTITWVPNDIKENTRARASVPGTYSYRWTISNGVCADSYAEIEVDYGIPIDVSLVSAGADDTVCFPEYTLSGSYPANTQGTWSLFSGPGTVSFDDVLDSMATTTVSVAGIYTYLWTVTSGICLTVIDTVVIEYLPLFATSAMSGPTHVCINQTGVTYQVTFHAGYVYEWTIPASFYSAGGTVVAGGGVALGGISSDNFVSLDFGGATFTGTLQVLETNYLCDDPPVSLDIEAVTIPIANAGTDVSMCIGNSTSLGGSPNGTANVGSGGTGFYTYSWTPTTFLDNALVSNPVSNTNTTQTYTLIVTDAVTICSSPADDIVVTVNPIPIGPVASDTASCVGDVTPDLTAIGLNIKWYNDIGLADLAWSGNPFATGKTAIGTYTYYATQSVNGCESPSTTVTLTIKNVPAAPVASDATICFGEITPDLTAIGSNIQWYSNAGLSVLEFSGSPYSTGIVASGGYTYYTTQTVNACESPATTVNLTINTLPAISSQFSIDQTLCNSNDGQITVSGTGQAPITYSIDGGLTYQASGTFTGLSGGNYPVFVMNGYGCEYGDSIHVIASGGFPPVPVAGSDSTYCDGEIISDITGITGSGGTLTWYSNPGLTTIIGVGTNYSPTATIGTTIYYVTETVGICESSSSQVTITINAIPAAPIASDTIICADDPVPDLEATGTNIIWYDDVLLTTQVGSGSPFSTAQSGAGIYPYFATQTVSGCESPATAVNLIINAIPLAPVSSDTTICFGEVTPSLTATGTNIEWFDDVLLTNLVGSGNSFNPGITSVGAYSFYVTQKLSNCQSLATTVVFTINAVPTAPVTSDTTICENIAPADLIASGTIIQWYSDPGLTSLEGTGSPFTTSETTAGTYNYYVTQTINNCESLSSTVILKLNATPSPLTVLNDTICSGETEPGFSATGTNILWYDDFALTNIVGTGNPFLTGQTNVGDHTYYVTQSINNCESPAEAFIFHIDTIAIIDSITKVNETGCNASDGLITVYATGNNLKFSIDAGISFQAGNVFNLLSNGNYPIVVKNDVGCSVTGTTQEILGNDTLIAPTIINNDTSYYCFGDVLQDISVTADVGDTMVWYSDPGLTIVIDTASIISPDNTIGTFTYYVTEISGICESPVSSATVVIYPIPPVPIIENDTVCDIDIIPDLVATGTNVKWYNTDWGNPLVNTGNTFATGHTEIGSYIYYVTQTENICESDIATIKLIITSVPDAPQSLNQSVCFGETVPDLTATGTTVQWYDDAALTNLVFSGSVFPTGNTAVGTYFYFVTQTDVCESVSTTVTLTINEIPVAPTSIDTSICYGEVTPYLSATGSNVKWYNDAALTFQADSGNIYVTSNIAVGIYSYYVTQTVNSCESPSTNVLLNINAVPSAPIANNDTVCNNETIPLLNATGTNVSWYIDPELTTLVNTGNTFSTGNNSEGLYSYYVIQTVNNCVSLYTPVSLKINPIPVITSEISTPESVCNMKDGNILISASGTPPLLYSIDNGLSYATNGISFDSLASGNYPIVVENGYGCTVSGSVIVITNGSAPPTPPSGDDAEYCEGDILNDLWADSISGGLLTWYSNPALTSIIGNGTSYSPMNSIGTSLYYVSESIDSCASPSSDVTVSINPIPVPPAVSNISICFGQAIPSLTATGDNIKWYNDAGLTNMVMIGNSFQTGKTSIGSYTYYATQTVNDCQSTTVSATLTINAIPSIPVSSDTAICSGVTTPDLFATGINIQWYDDASLTNLVNVGNTFTTGNTLPATYTYYVTQVANGCESPSKTIQLVINDIPLAPSSSDITICTGEAEPVLSATGSNLSWYYNNISNFFGNGNNIPSGQTSTGIYTYYVTQNLNNCESNTTEIALTINSTPDAPIASDDSICFGEPNIGLTATSTGGNVKWYNDIALSSLEFTGTTFTPTISNAGQYAYYVVSEENNCTSQKDTVLYTIHETPVITAQAFTNESVCNAQDGSISITASGTDLLYSIDGGTNYFASSSFDALKNGNYPVVVLNGVGCTDVGNTFMVSPGAAPPAPVAGADAIYCDGDAMVDLYATALGQGDTLFTDTIYWYNDAGLTNLIGEGSYFTPLSTIGATTYYVTEIMGGCESPSTEVDVTIYNVPSAPIVNDIFVCIGEIVPELVTTGSQIKWYSDNAGQPLVFVGEQFQTGETDLGTYRYFITDTENGCETKLVNATVAVLEIVPVPDPPTTIDKEAFFGQAIPDLEANGTTVQWYSDPGLTTFLDVGLTYTTGQTAVGSYTYYATQTTSCESSPATATLTIKEAPLAPIVSDEIICDGESIPYLIASGTNITWYASDTITTLYSGNAYLPSDNSPGIYTYFVTQTNSGYESPVTKVSFTINASPTSPISLNESVCLNDTIPALHATGTDINWYLEPALITLFFNGNDFETGESTVGTYTYYTTQFSNACESSPTAVSLTINPTPNIISEITQPESFCNQMDGSIEIEATGVPPLDYSINGGANFFSTNIFTDLPSGNYPIVIKNSYDCIVNGSSVILTAGDAPSPPSAEGATYCEGETLTAIEATGSGIGILTWYSDPGATDSIGTGSSLFPNNIIGTSNYYVTETIGGCESASKTVAIIINPKPQKIMVNDTSICYGNINPEITFSGNNVEWFTNMDTITPISIGNTFTPGVTDIGNYTYYIHQSENNCYSDKSTFQFNIYSIPASLNAYDTAICYGDNLAVFVANGTNVDWFDNPSLSNLLHSGNSYQVNQTSPGMYSYYATQTVNSCVSPASSFNLTINNIPSPPISNDVSNCFLETTPYLSATGFNIQWYDSTGSSYSGAGFATGQVNPGIYNYQVTQTVNNCESNPFDVSLTIYPIPDKPTIADTSACQSDTLTLSAIGDNIKWYSDIGLTDLLYVGNTFEIENLSEGLQSYYLTQSVNNCVSSFNDFYITVNENPLIISENYINQSNCESNDGSIEIEANGFNLQYSYSGGIFYSNISDTVGLGSGNYPIVVKDSISGCTTDGSIISISAGGWPGAPIVSESVSYCYGDVLTDLTATAQSNISSSQLVWFSNAGLTDTLAYGNTISPNEIIGTTSYYVVELVAGCQSPYSQSNVTINPGLVKHNFIGDSSYCIDINGTQLGLDFTDLDVNYDLYKNNIFYGSLPGNSTEQFWGNLTTGTYKVIATDNNTACSSLMNNIISVTTNNLPDRFNVLTVGTGAYCESDAGIEIKLDGSVNDIYYQLYLGVNIIGDPILGTGFLLTFPNVTAEGEYTVIAQDTSTYCTSLMYGSSDISIIEAPNIFHVYAPGESYCENGTGILIGLDDSNLGVDYTLLLDSVQIGDIKTGNGTEFDFGLQTLEGTYTIEAEWNNCIAMMQGSASITINPLPEIYDVSGGGPFCFGENGVVIELNNSEIGVNYQLYKENQSTGFYSQGTGNVLPFDFINEEGTYTVHAYNSSTQCNNIMNGSATINMNPLPLKYNIEVSNNGIYCAGENGVDISLPNSQTETNYNLLYNNTIIQTLVGTGSGLVFENIMGEGIYTIIAQTISTNCESEMNNPVSVTEISLPTIYSIVGDGYYCPETEGFQISLISTGNQVSYRLYRDNSAIGVSLVGEGYPLNFGFFSIEGLYKIEATNSSGCSVWMDSVFVMEYQNQPTANFVINLSTSEIEGCPPFNTEIISFTTGSVESSNWTFGDNSSFIGVQPPNHIFYNSTSQERIYTIECIVMSLEGCNYQHSETITVFPGATARFTSDTSGCSPYPVIFNNYSDGINFHWDFGDNITDTTAEPTHIFDVKSLNYDTIYTVELIAETDHDCMDTAYRDISVYLSPEPLFNIFPDSLEFPDATIHLVNNTQSSDNPDNWNYNWDMGDGLGFSNNEDPEDYTYSWPGTYQVSLTVSRNVYSCTETLSKPIFIKPAIPIINPINDTVFSGCEPFVVDFPDTTSLYADTWYWDYGYGLPDTTRAPRHIFEYAGTYDVNLTVSGPGGVTSDFVTQVIVYPKPLLAFTYQPSLAFATEDPITLANHSDSIDIDFIWEFGDGNTSSLINPQHIYDTEGTYYITLNAISLYGCQNSITLGPITIDVKYKVVMPNVFYPIPGGEPDNIITPDRNRTIFYPIIPSGVKVEGYEFSVFNTLGERIFYTNKINEGWTGYRNGVLQKQDVYFWVINVIYINDHAEKYSGNVTLIK